jgi:hypothetical protein
MDIKIDSLMPFDALCNDLENVFSVVDKNGKVIFLKDNKPAYILMKYCSQTISDTLSKRATTTLSKMGQQLSFTGFGSEIPPPVLEGAFRPKCNRSFDNVECHI